MDSCYDVGWLGLTCYSGSHYGACAWKVGFPGWFCWHEEGEKLQVLSS